MNAFNVGLDNKSKQKHNANSHEKQYKIYNYKTLNMFINMFPNF